MFLDQNYKWSPQHSFKSTNSKLDNTYQRNNGNILFKMLETEITERKPRHRINGIGARM